MPPGPVSRYDDVVARLRAAGCVFAEQEADEILAAADSAADVAAMVERRARGEPLEHVVGSVAFCGLRVAVGPGVFVPRRRTELLARTAAGLAAAGTGGEARAAGSGAVVVDLCCGCGAIAAVVATAVSDVELYAVDVDARAIACARRNLSGRAQVLRGDLFAPLPRRLLGRVDVLVANAPYVPTAALALMPAEARLHEPRNALDGGPDGLDVARRVVAEAPRWLAPGGHVLFEVGDDQLGPALDLVGAAGLEPSHRRDDDTGAVVVVGVRRSDSTRWSARRRLER